MADRRDEFFAEFERDGEEAVRRKRTSGHYGAERVVHADEWLRLNATHRESVTKERDEALKREEIEIARSAKDAAWEAAKAARIANRAAIIAAALAAISIIVSLVN